MSFSRCGGRDLTTDCLAAASLMFGSCQTLVWHLPNSGLAAAKPKFWWVLHTPGYVFSEKRRRGAGRRWAFKETRET